MKIIPFILGCLFVGNSVVNGVEELKVFQRNPDEFLWRLTIENETYSLLTVAMSGETCTESGKVEENDGKIRFVPTNFHDCPFPRILGDSRFVIVQKNESEYLVEEGRISDLESALSIHPQVWFDFFERMKDSKPERQDGEPDAAHNRSPAARSRVS